MSWRWLWRPALPLLWLACSAPPKAGVALQVGNAPSDGLLGYRIYLSHQQIALSRLGSLPVRHQNLAPRIRLTGEVGVDPAYTTHVRSPLPGQLLRVDTQLGAVVGVNTPLAQLVSPELAQLQGDYAAAVAQQRYTQLAVERMTQLAQSDASSRSELDAAVYNHVAATADLQRLQAKARLMFGDSADLNQVCAPSDGKMALKAPSSGMVLASNMTAGMMLPGVLDGASDSPLLATISDVNHLLVTTLLNVPDALRLQLHSYPQAQILRGDKPLPLQFHSQDALYEKHHAGTLLRFRLNNPQQQPLQVGDRVVVELSLPPQDVVVVPQQCILFWQNAEFVFVPEQTTEGMVFMPVNVTTQAYSQDEVMLTTELEVGREIICEGGILLLGLMVEAL